ncbi:hypothetical protein BDR05DRAFT_998244 [Suillus weaverae]|nr:hypothetical protein BDR05DRAFT_998244 [Suillus weaverae]
MQLDPNDLIDHGLVVHILKEGWQSYFPINSLLADLTCVTLHYAKVPTEFDLANEPLISYPNFCEAACMLPVLIGWHLNSLFKAEIAESFWKHYEGVLRAHNFQHNFAVYVCYDIMIRQHWVNNSLDFNLAIFQPRIFSHCLGLVKAEADSSMASRIASLEAQLDLLPIVTPLRWDKWEELLGAANVLDSFHNVPLGLQDGFRLSVSSSILSTFSPPNHNSALEHADFVDSQIEKEVAAG